MVGSWDTGSKRDFLHTVVCWASVCLCVCRNTALYPGCGVCYCCQPAFGKLIVPGKHYNISSIQVASGPCSGKCIANAAFKVWDLGAWGSGLWTLSGLIRSNMWLGYNLLTMQIYGVQVTYTNGEVQSMGDLNANGGPVRWATTFFLLAQPRHLTSRFKLALPHLFSFFQDRRDRQWPYHSYGLLRWHVSQTNSILDSSGRTSDSELHIYFSFGFTFSPMLIDCMQSRRYLDHWCTEGDQNHTSLRSHKVGRSGDPS